MPDILIFLVGLFALIPFLSGLTLMMLTAIRLGQKAEGGEESNRLSLPNHARTKPDPRNCSGSICPQISQTEVKQRITTRDGLLEARARV